MKLIYKLLFTFCQSSLSHPMCTSTCAPAAREKKHEAQEPIYPRRNSPSLHGEAVTLSFWGPPEAQPQKPCDFFCRDLITFNTQKDPHAWGSQSNCRRQHHSIKQRMAVRSPAALPPTHSGANGTGPRPDGPLLPLLIRGPCLQYLIFTLLLSKSAGPCLNFW